MYQHLAGPPFTTTLEGSMDAAVSAPAPTPGTLAAAAVLFLIGLAALAPVPATVAPYSFVTVIPAFLVAGVLGEKWLVVGAALGSLVAPIAYLRVTRYISRTGRTLPKASLIAFAILVVLSLALAAISWDTTVRYTSVTRATALVVQAVVPALLIAAAGLAMRSNLTMRRSLVLHWAAFAWLAWSAFPWHGELL